MDTLASLCRDVLYGSEREAFLHLANLVEGDVSVPSVRDRVPEPHQQGHRHRGSASW